jgi:dipeptidyl aminopeptidase/acylaminoacyl peptidase
MIRAARFAPDGQTFVYGAAWDGPPVRLYLARTDSTEATPLPLPPAELHAVASTGEMAVGVGHAYRGWMGQGTLARAPLLGGTHREILEGVRHADFSPDGSELCLVRRVQGFEQLEYPAGTVLHRTSGYLADPRVSPDGQRVAFADHPVWADDRGGVSVVDRSGRKTALAEGLESVHGVAWAPGGNEVWYTGGRPDGWVLAAADLAGGTRTLHKSLAPIELFDVSADGRLLMGTQRPERQASALLAGWDGPRLLTVPGEASVARGLSADGRAVLVTDQVPAGYESYLVQADRPGAVRLSSGDGYAISDDGTRALAVAADARSMLVSPLGPGTTRTFPIPEDLACDSAPSWLPGGKRIVFVGRRGSEPSRAYLLDVEAETATPFAAPGVSWSHFGGIPVSPDGRTVMLLDGSGAVMRWPIEGGSPLPVPGLGEEEVPLAFTADGRGIFVAGRGVPIPIERLDLETGKRTPWMTVAPADQAGLRFAVAAITPDGRHWALSTSRLHTDLYVVEGMR